MSNNYVALLAEGASESAILDVLIDNELLLYTRSDLIEEEVIRVRSASAFQRKYLNHRFGNKIEIFRVHDSKKEKFKLSKAYLDKIEIIHEIYTTPEIEILFIILEDEYKKFKNCGEKPSIYVKKHYKKLSNYKGYQEVYNFWNDNLDDLVKCIEKYAKYSVDNRENTLAALLK